MRVILIISLSLSASALNAQKLKNVDSIIIYTNAEMIIYKDKSGKADTVYFKAAKKNIDFVDYLIEIDKPLKIKNRK